MASSGEAVRNIRMDRLQKDSSIPFLKRKRRWSGGGSYSSKDHPALRRPTCDGQVRSVFMLEAGMRSPDDEASDPGSHSACNGGTALPFLRRGICVSIRLGFIRRAPGAGSGCLAMLLTEDRQVRGLLGDQSTLSWRPLGLPLYLDSTTRSAKVATSDQS